MIYSYRLFKASLFGSAVLPELVKGGYEVTLLSRSEKPHEDLPSTVRLVIVDYNDTASLTNALKGQDAVVSTVGMRVFLVRS
ncbi:hypothetical protein FJTKL_12703 [Diaporthe vaccinii]|uniref:NAD(P)-binding domain-containing protein n=1 Tax=Diaporthe vaccinii TaxID=105482 RepID=A0ABR4ECS5_9PEZI